jgi:tetratricopeptide (TPR) repeat protein
MYAWDTGQPQPLLSAHARQEAVELGELAFEDPQGVDVAAVMIAVDLLLRRHDATQADEELVTAERLAERAVAHLPSHHAGAAVLLARLADLAVQRWSASRRSDDLDRLIDMARRANGAEQPLAERGRMLTHLGVGLAERAERTQDARDLDSALSSLREAVACKAGQPDFSAALALLADMLRRHHSVAGVSSSLEDAVQLLREAVIAVPDAADRLADLGDALAQRAVVLARAPSPDLDEAVALLRLAAGSVDDPESLDRLRLLADVLRMRFEVLGDVRDLGEAIDCYRAVLTARVAQPAFPDAGGPSLDLGELRWQLAGLLQTRYGLSGHDGDIDEAEELLLQAREEALPPNDTEVLSALAMVWAVRGGSRGRTSDLDAAVAAFDEVLTATPPNHPGWASRASNLAGALLTRFDRGARLIDLNRAIDVLRRLVDAIPPQDPRLSAFQHNLGSALARRHAHLRSSVDIADALMAHRAAIEGVPATAATRPDFLCGLATAYLQRFEERRDLSDADRAVRLLREGLDDLPHGHPSRASLQSTLAAAHGARFEHGGGHPSDIDAAVTALRAAVDLGVAGIGRQSALLNNLAAALLARWHTRADAADLAEATEVAERAVDSAQADDPARAGALLNVARAHWGRRRTDQDAPVAPAAAALREAIASRSAAAELRLRAARFLAAIGQDSGDMELALQGAGDAVALLPVFAWRGLDRASQERLLGHEPSIATEAAAFATIAGSGEQAVQLLESGRVVLWNQLLDIRREQSALHHVAPGLATRLVEIRAELDVVLPVNMPV